MIKIPGDLNVVTGLAPTAGGSAATGDYISLKYAHRVWIVFSVKQGEATASAFRDEGNCCRWNWRNGDDRSSPHFLDTRLCHI